MNPRPVIDDKTLQRLLRGEIHKMNQDLADPVDLLALRVMDPPETPTKGGGVHRFDKEAIDRLHASLSPLVRANLRVPIRFYLPHDVRGEAFVAEQDAIDAILQLGAAQTRPRDGRLWMSLALAQRFAQQHPTLVQFVRQ